MIDNINENQGHLDIVFRKKESGKTYLAKQFYKMPLQIRPPYYQDDDGTAFLYLLNPSGGILQHDRLLTQVKVEEHAKAFITTPGNTKFYKMDEGHAEVENQFVVESGGVLEYLPEHNVPFADSVTYQNNEFRLAHDSVLIASDLVTAGRVSRDEIFEYELYSSKTKIYVDDKLVGYDNTLIEPKKSSLNQLGLLEGFQSNGNMFIYKNDMDPNLVDLIKDIETDTTKVKFGASMITPSLMIIRFVGNNILDIQEVLLKIWSVTRKSILGKNSVRIRKY